VSAAPSTSAPTYPPTVMTDLPTPSPSEASPTPTDYPTDPPTSFVPTTADLTLFPTEATSAAPTGPPDDATTTAEQDRKDEVPERASEAPAERRTAVAFGLLSMGLYLSLSMALSMAS